MTKTTLRYRDTADGTVFEGATEGQVVRAMHRAAWLVPPGKGEYMREVAARCLEIGRDGRIDPRDASRFLSSLVAHGYLETLGGD